MQALPRIATRGVVESGRLRLSGRVDPRVARSGGASAPDRRRGVVGGAVAQPHRRHRRAARGDQAVALRAQTASARSRLVVRSPNGSRSSRRSRLHTRHRPPVGPANGQGVQRNSGSTDTLPTAPLTVDSPLEDKRAFAAMNEEVVGAVLDAFGAGRAGRRGRHDDDHHHHWRRRQRHHALHQPPRPWRAPLPALVHLHGGGMAIGSATDVGYARGREYLAAHRACRRRCRVPQLRRASSARTRIRPVSTTAQPLSDGHSPTAAISASSHLIVGGESGGGNLTLTVAHKAKREGWIHEIAGFYAQCPYISNRWHEPPDELPSLRECDGYFIGHQQLAMMGVDLRPDRGTRAGRDVLRRCGDATTSWQACRRTSSRSTNSTRCATRDWTTTAGCCARACPQWGGWWRAPATAATYSCPA